jgi:hypothetical protein
MSTTSKAAEARIEKLRKERADEFANAPPSRVIEMALEDLEAVQAHKDDYFVDMSYWHQPAVETDHDRIKNAEKRCVVCFAGSVMANTLSCDKLVDMGPGDFEDAKVVRRLSALNLFRMGHVHHGLHAMGIQPPAEISPYPEPVSYFTPGKPNKAFKTSMRKLVDLLRSHGL